MNLPSANPASSTLGTELRAARHRRKLTQKALASRARVDVATVQSLEGGRGTLAPLLLVLSVLEHRFLEQPTNTGVGSWLVSHRKRLRISQRVLSERAGISKPAIIAVEHGRGHLKTLTACMSAMGLPIALRADEDEYQSGSANSDFAPRREFVQGDCITVMRGIEARSVNLIVTSPPYNLGKRYHSYRDKLPLVDYRAFAQAWLTEAVRLLADDGSLWLNVGNTRDPDGGTLPLEYLYWPLIKNLGLTLVQTIVWHHHTGLPQVAKFTQLTERWLWCTKRAKGFVWNLDAVRVPPKTTGKRTNPYGANPSDLWSFTSLVHNAKARPDHPCPQPVEMVERIVNACSRPGGVVLDPFGGSGTTAVAAVRNGRGFVSIEVSPRYHRTGIDRLRTWESSQDAAVAAAAA